MHPQPQTISKQLIQGLAMLSAEERHNTFILRRYKKQAENLRTIDPFFGYIVLGMIATLERDIPEMHRQYGRALKLNPGNSTGYHNYAISLSKFGLYADYIVYAQKEYDINRGDVRTLEFLIDANLIGAHIEDAYQLLNEWNKLCPDRSNPVAEGIESALKIMSTHGITQQELIHLQQVALSVLQRRNIYIHFTHFQVKHHEGIEWIHYVYELDEVSSEERIELEDELERELQDLSPHMTDAVTIEYAIEEPELDDFMGYMETSIEQHPENVVEPDVDQLNRIAKLIGAEA